MLNHWLVLKDRNGATHWTPSFFEDGFITEFPDPVFERKLESIWPTVDLHEHKDKYVLQADLPGMNEKEIKIEMNDGRLVIEGSRESESSKEDPSLVFCERQRSAFRRSFRLGDEVNADKIEASYRNGVLTITLPKTEKVLPRSIPIQVA